MSVEGAIIARERPHMLVSMAKELISEELSKGCRPDISDRPVSLEPNFTPLWALRYDQTAPQGSIFIQENPISRNDLARLQVWISPDHKFDWTRSELFIKQLSRLNHRVVFEVTGNKKNVSISFLVDRQDLRTVIDAFHGAFELCEITTGFKSPLNNLTGYKWIDIRFEDHFPHPPYSHLLTRPPELKISPLTMLMSTISKIEPPAIGLYQLVFHHVNPAYNWNRNIQILLDLEYNIKLQSGFQALHRYAQQSPSGDLRQMSWEVENKAHNDKPFYFAAFRLAVVGAGFDGKNLLASMSSFAALFQHGGSPARIYN